MKKIFWLAGVMTLLVVSSCKKDKDSNGGDNGGNTKLLKKVTKTENGITTIYNLNYEGNKLRSFNSTDNLESTALTFDAAGNITRIEIRDHNDYSTYMYTYNNGIPVSGSLKVVHKVAGEPDDIVQDDVFTYTVVNNQVTTIKQEMKLAETELTANLTYTNTGNLDKITIDGDEVYTVSFTYGTKKPGFPTMSKWVLGLGETLEFYAKNELLTAFYDFPGTDFDFSYTTSYTYDADGYPLTSSDGEVALKYEY
ncbi:hypothetical protein [Longitalea luteola]|uniref:hypothetical protein n=1 Tax=Longitalea luteola TaxID=2812563 RepID=UPI001A968BD4|nr:hypothetical protein [Longitalea luteola]